MTQTLMKQMTPKHKHVKHVAGKKTWIVFSEL